MIDWDAGSYETTSGVDYAPAAEATVAQADIRPGETVVDLGCGSGNAALAASERTDRVIGVDISPRLLEVTAERARGRGVSLDLRQGDIAALPLDSASADVVLSVFGVIFVDSPAAGLAEIRRVLVSSGRALIAAWQPRGPIVEMVTAIGRLLPMPGGPPRRPFAWHDPAALGDLATESGLRLLSSEERTVAVRAASPAAFVAANEQQPMSLAMRPRLQDAGIEETARRTSLEVLTAANADPAAFLIHCPYVVHTLRPAD